MPGQRCDFLRRMSDNSKLFSKCREAACMASFLQGLLPEKCGVECGTLDREGCGPLEDIALISCFRSYLFRRVCHVRLRHHADFG